MKIRKSSLFIVCFFLGICLPFCGIAKSEQNPIHIAMFLWRGITKAEQGFMNELSRLGIDAKYEVFNLKNSKKTLASIIREIKKDKKKYDYIYSFGTNTSLVLKETLGQTIPMVFNISSTPLESGIIDGMLRRKGNISGASNFINFDVQFRIILNHLRVKKIAYLFNPREKNGTILLQKFLAFAQKNGIQVIYKRTPTEQYLEKALKEAVKMKPDLIYFPNDSFLNARAEKIIRYLKPYPINTASAHESFLKNNVGFGVVPDYEKLGKGVARIIQKNLEGTALKDIPIYVDNSPKVIVNLNPK